MAISPILDHRGLPIRTSDLKQEFATPQLTRMRSPFAAAIGEVTPEWLASTLRSCEHGQNPERYLALAEAMEERDLHYRSVLGTRKMALTGREIIVEPGGTSLKDKKAAALVREVLSADEFADVVGDQQDALGKGFSVGEIIWDTSGSEWRPAKVVYKDPRWFAFPQHDPYWPYRRDGGRFLPLEPYKFIVHLPKLKSGLPLRGGLARAAAWAWMSKNFTLKDWLAFCEVYGQPLRLGKYTPGADKGDIDVLMDAVAAIGSDFAGVFPNTMEIELKESGNKGASANVYERLCDYLDKQISKGVLGQTETADATPGRLGAATEKHEVRQDILRFDARQNIVTNKRDLVTPLVRLNFGPDVAIPKVRYDLPDLDDKKLLYEAIQGLVPMGMPVPANWAASKFGVPAPKDSETLLTAPTGAANPNPNTPIAQAQHAANCPHCAAHAQTTPVNNPTAQIIGAYTDQLQQAGADPFRAMLDTIRQAVQSTESDEELRNLLLSMYGSLPDDQLREVMAMGFALSTLAGRYQATQDE